MQLLFATNNAHKVSEVRALLPDDVQVQTLSDAGIDIDPDETGDTFRANARIKAEALRPFTDGWIIADDSGIEVDALGGAPGVHSKRFSPEATAASNNRLLLDRLDGVESRTARFRCVLAVLSPTGDLRFLEGRCEGRISTRQSGTEGFGYDPIFEPDEADGRSMAQLSTAEKNAISHRGRAFSKLPDLLASVGPHGPGRQ